HRLDEAANAAAQTSLDRVEPSLTRKQPLGARRCRAILVHGVVSPGASTPGFGCRVSTGDYVTPFPTTSRTGPPLDRRRAQRWHAARPCGIPAQTTDALSQIAFLPATDRHLTFPD